MNKIYFGDNLEILREFESESVDLICTDPPFNSGRNYNTFLTSSKAQQKAFDDIWSWDDVAMETRRDIEEKSLASDVHKRLDNALRGYDFVLQNGVSKHQGSMRSYLAFMGTRIVELYRVLRQTGSIYLHCDPTASHYLKGIMDAVFGYENFRNEIIWHYHMGSSSSKDFRRKHDVLFKYSVSNDYLGVQIKVPRRMDSNRYNKTDEDGRKYHVNGVGKRFYEDEGIVPDDVWTYCTDKKLTQLNSQAKERLGYDTQKPRVLYERMIKASSNVGDVVLDPFCGCGTTIDAAHTLNRNWIGIDLTILALDPMQKRMLDRHGLKPSLHYEIDGYPTNMQEVRKLVQEQGKRHDFANWAVTRLGLDTTENVGDGGFDGTGKAVIWNPKYHKDIDTRVIAEVKSGNFTIKDVRAFCHSMSANQAEVGIFITIQPISSGMKQIQADMGTFEHNSRTYNRLQFWQIDDGYFDNPESLNQMIQLPWQIESRKKSERHVENHQMGLL